MAVAVYICMFEIKLYLPQVRHKSKNLCLTLNIKINKLFTKNTIEHFLLDLSWLDIN